MQVLDSCPLDVSERSRVVCFIKKIDFQCVPVAVKRSCKGIALVTYHLAVSCQLDIVHQYNIWFSDIHFNYLGTTIPVGCVADWNNNLILSDFPVQNLLTSCFQILVVVHN